MEELDLVVTTQKLEKIEDGVHAMFVMLNSLEPGEEFLYEDRESFRYVIKHLAKDVEDLRIEVMQHAVKQLEQIK